MDRDFVNWRGYIPAITTPFTKGFEFDEDAFARLLDWYIEMGLQGIVVLGTQGEWFSLAREEKRRLLEIAGAKLDGKMTAIAGCNAFSAREAIENAEMAADCNFDGVLLCPPPYIVPTDVEIYSFYKDFCAASPLPVCIYNWPPGTNVDMKLPLLSRLADLDKVVALKNSTPDLQNFIDVFFGLKDRIRVFGVPMNELGISLVVNHDADGLMGAGGVLGADHPNFFRALWDGDIERARLLGARDEKYMHDWFHPDKTGKFGSAQAIFKTALNLQGLPGGYPRRPILPLEPEGVEIVRATLVELGKIEA
ncbi:MAG: dihydrodipicolinate synthase family protein [Parvularculaceae bacterium]|nr:dihydrodipicolinate synthase family protein [Parvularculaceae bacterium]